MNTKDKIVSYLKDKHDPQALILHGSRAAGYATENSDWDIFMLDTNELPSETGRKFGAELDVVAKKLPIDTKQEVENEFGCQLKHTEVLSDTGGVGRSILKMADEMYTDGFNATDEEIEAKNNNLRRTYFRLAERSQHIAHLYRLNFVAQSARFWYQILQDEWQDNFYIAFPRIQEEDPEYYDNLMVVLESSNQKERLSSARAIYSELFGEDLADLG